MKPLKFLFKNSGFSARLIGKTGKKLNEEIEKMREASLMGYEDERASINLPVDKNMLEAVKKVISGKGDLNPGLLVVVGIGGSNLGTVAVQEAVLGKLYNQVSNEMKVLYADTVDSDSLADIVDIMKGVLKSGRNVILNVISKSGVSTETISNFQVLLEVLKKYRKNYRNYVVVTTEEGSPLWNLGLEKGFDLLWIPKKVGGRFSVMSPVGLFPLGLLGINLDSFVEGAAVMSHKCMKNFESNPAAISAVVQFLSWKKGKNISDLFLFSNDLESLGKWNRQLLGESVGKEKNLNGNKINAGITPTVSIGSTDLHSMAQLYLGGPYDKLTTFVKVKKQLRLKVPLLGFGLVRGIEGKNLSRILDSILEGLKIAFRKNKRPYIEIELPDKNEKTIGQFLQFKMMEMMYLGYLMNVNVFNQPSVEKYKKETRDILS